MQEGSPRGDEAGEWLRDHFRGDPEPKVDITWIVGESNPIAYREVLEILFAPEPGDQAA